MTTGGDPSAIYADEVYLRYLATLNGLHFEGIENKFKQQNKMNKEEIRIKCLELAVDYMNHLTNYQNGHCIQDNMVVAIAKTFENYITKEED